MTDSPGSSTARSATTQAPLDVLDLVATNVAAKAGVYALLLGSGISYSAEVPNGWGIQCELVERLARLATPDDNEAIALAAAHPDVWWQERGYPEPFGYSQLLTLASPTPAGRTTLLEGFFTPTEEDLRDGRKIPAAAHRAIAQLVRRGLIKVIVTTNFDPLTEQAIREAGVYPQIIHSSRDLARMTPLAHAECTVIKVNGDRGDLITLNTDEELRNFNEGTELHALLTQVFTEYGLIACGWSGEWDPFIRGALTRARPPQDDVGDGLRPESASSGYPIYWSAFEQPKPVTARLIRTIDAQELPLMDADTMFTELDRRALAVQEILSRPTVSIEVAVKRLRRALPDPTRRTDVEDLVFNAIDKLSEQLWEPGVPVGIQEYVAQLGEHAAAAQPVLHLLTAGVYADRDGAHTELWVAALERLMRAGLAGRLPGAAQWANETPRYPALLGVIVCVAAAVAARREGLARRLLEEPRWTDTQFVRMSAAQAVHRKRVFQHDLEAAVRSQTLSGFARWPSSEFVRRDTLDALKLVDPDAVVRQRLVDAAEYRVALVQQLTMGRPGGLSWVEGKWLARESHVPGPGDGPAALRLEPEAQVHFGEDAEDGGWWTGQEDRAAVMAAVEEIAEQERTRRIERAAGW